MATGWFHSTVGKKESYNYHDQIGKTENNKLIVCEPDNQLLL